MCTDIEAEFTSFYTTRLRATAHRQRGMPVFELIGCCHYYIQALVVNFPAVLIVISVDTLHDSSGNHTILNRDITAI